VFKTQIAGKNVDAAYENGKPEKSEIGN